MVRRCHNQVKQLEVGTGWVFVLNALSAWTIIAKPKFLIFRRAEEVAQKLGHPPGVKPKLGSILE